MQIKDLSVSQKLWCLVIMVMALLLSLGLGMTTYLVGVEAKIRAHAQTYDQRISMAREWRGQVEVATGNVLAASLTKDPQTIAFFDQRNAAVRTRVDQVREQMAAQISTPEGRSLMGQLMTATDSWRQAQQVFRQQDWTQRDIHQYVNTHMLPIVDTLIQGLDQLIEVQVRVREAGLAEAQNERKNAILVGGAALALVTIMGLLLSAWLVRQLTQPLARAVNLADEIAKGNLTHDVYDDRKDEMGQLLRSLNAMTQRLRSVVGEVRHGVDSVSSAASQIASGNQDLSSRTEQTASNLEETAASIEELTATVNQSADTARQATQLAATAVQAAERGGEVVSQVVMSMDQINTSSRKISDIIGVIDGIAFQTNILALNAAVEAARAGEQGRGFAVVAGEVRALAGRSAEAAKEIKALITTSVNNVDMGAEQVAQAGQSMQEIVESVRRVTDLIGEISASTTEQRDGFAQVNQAVSNLDQMTQQNAALVEESSAAAVAMSEQAQRLAQVVSVFNVGHSVVTQAASAVVAKAAPASVAAVTQPTAKVAASRVKPLAAVARKRVEPEVGKQPMSAAKSLPSNDDDWETF